MVGNYSMIREIKEYAKKNNVPIMVDEGIDFLTTFFSFLIPTVCRIVLCMLTTLVYHVFMI